MMIVKKKVLVKSYPSLKNDSVFKYLFKNKETRSYFDKLVYETTKIDISRYKLIDQELNSGNKKKDYRLDILLEKEDTIINIELNSKYNEYVQNKSKAYIYRIAGYLYNEGEQYKNKNIIQINYNYALLKINNRKVKNAIVDYKFQNKRYELEKEGITIYDVYVENYKGICYNGNNLKETLLSVFNAKSREELIRIGNKNKEVEKLMDNLEKLLTSEEFYNLFDYEKERKRELNYYKDKGIEIGEKRGRIAGIKETKRENALVMIKDKLDNNTISKYTGLSIKDVNKLRNSLN